MKFLGGRGSGCVPNEVGQRVKELRVFLGDRNQEWPFAPRSEAPPLLAVASPADLRIFEVRSL